MLDVVQQANDSPFGLAAAVFSQNITRALTIAHRLKAGTAWVQSNNSSSHITYSLVISGQLREPNTSQRSLWWIQTVWYWSGTWRVCPCQVSNSQIPLAHLIYVFPVTLLSKLFKLTLDILCKRTKPKQSDPREMKTKAVTIVAYCMINDRIWCQYAL